MPARASNDPEEKFTRVTLLNKKPLTVSEYQRFKDPYKWDRPSRSRKKPKRKYTKFVKKAASSIVPTSNGVKIEKVSTQEIKASRIRKGYVGGKYEDVYMAMKGITFSQGLKLTFNDTKLAKRASSAAAWKAKREGWKDIRISHKDKVVYLYKEKRV